MQTAIYIIDILVFITLALGAMFGLRWKYMNDIAPCKKFPKGRMVAEFWTELGPRYRDLCEIATNGWEIKAPAGHKVPRYFFNKSSKGMTKYPLQPLLPFKFVQADVPIVSWIEDHPEPIDPKRVDKDGNPTIMMTAEMHDLVRDNDSLAAWSATEDDVEEKLRAALENRLNKNYVYIGLVVAGAGAVGAAVFAYQAFAAINKMAGG